MTGMTRCQSKRGARHWLTGLNVSKPGQNIIKLFLRHFLENVFNKLERLFLKGPSIRAQWKGINRKQITRWQHLSQLKASAFFSLQKN